MLLCPVKPDFGSGQQVLELVKDSMALRVTTRGAFSLEKLEQQMPVAKKGLTVRDWEGTGCSMHCSWFCI